MESPFSFPAPDVSKLATGAGVAKYLNGLGMAVSAGGEFIDPYDWSFVADPVYLDRVAAVRNDDPSFKRDVSHAKFLISRSTPLWAPISVPPAYRDVPAGERLSSFSREVPVGAKFVLKEDTAYYGEVVPAGSVLTMVGYKTSRDIINGRLTVVFAACAQFPDGTYRNLPSQAEALAA